MEVVMLEAGLKLKRRGDLRGRFLQDYRCAVHCKALRRAATFSAVTIAPANRSYQVRTPDVSLAQDPGSSVVALKPTCA